MFEDTCHTIYHIIIYMIIYNIPYHNHIHDVRLFIIYTLLYEVPHGKQHTSYVIISMIKCTLIIQTPRGVTCIVYDGKTCIQSVVLHREYDDDIGCVDNILLCI